MPAHRFATSLGPCALRWEGAQLTGFDLPRREGGTGEPEVPPAGDGLPPAIAALADRVRRHLDGDLQDFAVEPFAWEQVTAFQRAVYEATLAVKAGQTATYGEIARAIGEPASASRAVAAALGANPWPLLVPCHRIVGADGMMTGFSGPGGVKTKVRLLAIEGSQLFAE